MITRGKSLVNLVRNLYLPNYESTKTTTKEEKLLLLKRIADNPELCAFFKKKPRKGFQDQKFKFRKDHKTEIDFQYFNHKIDYENISKEKDEPTNVNNKISNSNMLSVYSPKQNFFEPFENKESIVTDANISSSALEQTENNNQILPDSKLSTEKIVILQNINISEALNDMRFPDFKEPDIFSTHLPNEIRNHKEISLSISTQDENSCPDVQLNQRDMIALENDSNRKHLEDFEDFEEPYMSSGSEYLPETPKNTISSSASSPSDHFKDIFNSDVINQKKIDVNPNKKYKYRKNKLRRRKQINENKNQENARLITKETESSEDEIEIRSSLKNPITKKRIRNKRHCCLICHAVICNLPRHLETRHASDCCVAKILAIPKYHKLRRQEFGRIQRQGDFYHNCEVLRTKKGELILTRCPTDYEKQNYTYSDYGPCPDCLGFMLKKHIGIHIKNNKCIENPVNKDFSTRKPIAESNALVNGIQFSELDEEFVSNILDKLRNDDISQTCKNDELITRFGNMIFEKYHTSQSELVRQSMRQLGRLLLELRKLTSPTLKLSECLNAKYFDKIITATKSLCDVLKKPTCRPEFNTPSLGLKIGYNLKKCASIERGKSLRLGDLNKDKELTNFLTLMDLEWSIKISSNALNTLHARKFNASQLLPLTTDLVKLNSYLEKEMKLYKTELENATIPTLSSWTTFASLLLARIVLFNKRRSGEASKMKISQYMMRPLWEDQTTEELKKSMSAFEQELAKRLVVVEIEGKRGRKVPILLTPQIKSGIDLLLSKKNLVGINKENPYIFARGKDSILNLRGHDVIRKFAEKADLQAPQNVCGTKLRKYIATVCQVFNLSENETDWLARHLGHDIRVHREFYRLHENAVELTKISRLLLAVDQGQANIFAGKQLKDIEITDLPYVEDDKDNEDNQDESDSDSIIVSKADDITVKFDDLNKISKTVTKSKAISLKKEVVKVPWSKEETQAVLTFFRCNITKHTVPGKEKCEECLEKNSEILCKRKWTDIKYHVKNQIDRIKRQKRK